MVAYEFPPDLGGVESYSWGLAGALAEAGIEVTLYTRRDRPSLPCPSGTHRKPILSGRRHIDLPLLRGESVDVWHPTNAAYAWLALEDSRPVVVSVHGNDFLKPYILSERHDFSRAPVLWRWKSHLHRMLRPHSRKATLRLLSRALPRCRRILANSRYTESVLLEKIPACQGLTRVAGVGVSESFLSWSPPAGLERHTNRLITVARLSEPRKNIDLVLRSLAKLSNLYDWYYNVIGEGSDRQRLEALARELGIADRVRFLGSVDDETLRIELASAGLMVLVSSVLPGSHEGFGIVYLEANACGTPVLAARSGGAVEAVDEGRSGFFLESLDEEALSEALRSHLSGQRRFDDAECRSWAENFRWSRVAETAIASYSAEASRA